MTKKFYLGLTYFTSMAALTVTRILFDTVNFSNPYLSETYVFTLITQVICLGLIPFTMYMLWQKKHNKGRELKALVNDFAYKKIDKRYIKNIIIISLLATFVTTCVSYLWQTGLYLIGYNFGKASSSESYGLIELIIELFFIAVLPAVFEEFTSRGLLRTAFTKTDGKKYIIVTALLFALMHQNITQTGYTFVGGLFMATMVYYTRSILPAMIYHFINNAIATLQSAFSNDLLSNLYNFLFSTVLGLIIAVVLFIGAVIVINRCFKDIKKIACLKVPVRVYDTVIYESRFYDFSVYSLTAPEKTTRRDNLFFYAAILLNTVATAFSLVWGLML